MNCNSDSFKEDQQRCPYLYTQQLEVYFKNNKFWPLAKSHNDYNLITKYMKNTHGNTHKFELEIIKIFRVFREDEFHKYKYLKENSNRMLLWHGSQASNFSGIFSKGLVAGCKDAPNSGKMFGNGVYFADMFSKSVQYCKLNQNQSHGFLLLCEVIIDQKNVKEAKGQTQPDPKENYMLQNGAIIPLGKPILAKANAPLLYNEYIVYDESLIFIKYLVEVKLM